MEENHMTPRKRRRRRCRRSAALLCLVPLLLVAVCATIGFFLENRSLPGITQGIVGIVQKDTPFCRRLENFAEHHDLARSDWPEKLLELGEKNPEAEEFVLNYPLKKDDHPEIDLSDLKDSSTVPLLMQWDERWGYSEYSGSLLGLSGCGPTCLSMVSIYLLNAPDLDPRTVAEFSMENGYSVEGNGSAWTLISEGGPKLGLDITQIPLVKDHIFRNLEAGNPIICIMGPGDFTTSGHFIVLTGCEDGKLRVNDPNSRERSARLWEFDQIKNQIRNLWVCR